MRLRIRSGLDIFLILLAVVLLVVVAVGIATRSNNAPKVATSNDPDVSVQAASAGSGEAGVNANFGWTGTDAENAASDGEESADSEEEAAAGDEQATLEEIDQPDEFSASWDLNGTFAIVRAIMNVNVRVGPSLDYGVKRSIPVETEVQVMRRSVDNQWIRVMLSDGEEGWIYGQLLEFQQ